MSAARAADGHRMRRRPRPAAAPISWATTNPGTDAGAMQRVRGGYRAMTYSIPTRYIHTVTECVSKKDLQAAIDLLAAWLGG